MNRLPEQFPPRRRLLLASCAAVCALAWLPSTAWSQDRFPSRPVEIVVPWGAGGGADQLARRLSKLMEPDLKVAIPVVNVPGATGNTGMTKMLNAAPDDHTTAELNDDTLETIDGSNGR